MFYKIFKTKPQPVNTRYYKQHMSLHLSCKLRMHKTGLQWGTSEINLEIKLAYTYLKHRQCFPGDENLFGSCN